MKVLSGAVVSVVLASSACGSGHSLTPPATTLKETSATAQASALAKLPAAVRKAVVNDLRAAKHPSKYSTVNTIEVYGPGSRTALNAAMNDERLTDGQRERGGDFYLTVLYGDFDCVSCSRPCCNVPDPRGTITMEVWSPNTDLGDFGLMSDRPRALSRLHRLIRIKLR